MRKENYQFGRINKFFAKLINVYCELFFRPIIINACVFQSYGRIVPRNWGDDINYYFLKELFKERIVIYDYSSLSHRKKKNNYLIIGSIITLLCNEQSIIWGAGVIDPTHEIPAPPLKVLAVRGPLTRNYLLKKGIPCPEVYGDPALLLPYVYKPDFKKKYRLGIIPHYQDYDDSNVIRLTQSDEVILIKTERYEGWKTFIDQINSCERIASSSLHGLIIAEAYGIPNLWLEISGKLLGGNFKFYDFFSSIKKEYKYPYLLTSETSIESIINQTLSWKKGEINLSQLINVSPFPLHLSYSF